MALLVFGPGGPSGIHYFHNDHLGTPKALTDKNGKVKWAAAHTPFGTALISENKIENPFRFPGQYFDGETGLNYNYFRNYYPSTGRYIESDPTGVDSDLNTYLYALSNPVMLTDPDGLEAIVPGGEPTFIPKDPPLPFDPCFGPSDANCKEYNDASFSGAIFFQLCRNTFGDRPDVNCVRKCLILYRRFGSRGLSFLIRTHFKCWDLCRFGF